MRKILFFVFAFSLFFLLPTVKIHAAATCIVTTKDSTGAAQIITGNTAPRISLIIKGTAITKGNYYVKLTNTTGPLLKDGTTSRTIGSSSITNWNNNEMTAQNDGELDTASFDGSADIGSKDPYNVGTYNADVYGWDSQSLVCNGTFQIHPNSSSSTSSTVSIFNGSYGCSFKYPTDGSITVSTANMLIPCQSGGICTQGDKSSIQTVGGVTEVDNGFCVSTGNQCPVCDPGYEYSSTNQNCESASDASQTKPFTVPNACSPDQGCYPGLGCAGPGTPDKTQPLSLCENGTSCPTALGNLPTNLSGLLTRVFSIALSIAGVVALGLIIISGYRIMISQGNPEQIKNAREQLTAAIIGLLFIIFSLVILQIIGANILNIPGFK